MHSRSEQLGKQMPDVWSQILYYWSRRFYQEEDRVIHMIMDYNLRHLYELMINLQMGIHINIHCCSVAQSCLTLCDRMDCSMPGFPVLHHLLEHVSNSCPSSRWCHPTNLSSVILFSSSHQSLPASASFLPMSQFFTSQGTGASASVLPVTIQECFPLRLAG